MSTLWQEAMSPEGRPYYYNTQTRETRWEKPPEMMAPLPTSAVIEVWKEYETKDGRKYWYNTESKQSVWDMPVSLKAARMDQVAQQTFVAGGVMTFGNDDVTERSLAIPGQLNEVAPDGTARPMGMLLPQSAFEKNDPQYATLEEAEAAFIKMLRRSGVSPDWTWEQTMRSVIKEPQYRALKDPKDRKSAFEKYAADTRLAELEKAKDRITKLRQDFNVMLKSHPEITHISRWKTVRPNIEGETIFRSTANEAERRSLFEEYIAGLRVAHDEDEAIRRREASDELTNLLHSLDLEPNSRWADVQEIIKETPLFKRDPKFRVLTKFDVLAVYENHIKVLERVNNDQKQSLKDLKQRTERKNREAFTSLLQELRSQGHIRAGTKWRSIYPLIANDDRFEAILGQSGSTPLDFFWDICEEIDRGLRSKRNLVLDFLEERRIEVQPRTTFEEFDAVIQTDPRTSNIDKVDLKNIFNKILEKIQRRGDDLQHPDKYQRRRMDDLRSAMKHLQSPRIAVTDSWEQVRMRVENLDEYVQLGSEDLARQAFDKYIRRLKDKLRDTEPESLSNERSERRGNTAEVDKYSLATIRSRDADNRDRAHDKYRERDGHHGKSYREQSGFSPSRADRRSSRDPGSGEPAFRRSRSPEVDAYEAERRKAASDRERQYRESGIGRREASPSGTRHRESSHQSGFVRDHYDRERREREEERERNYARSSRDRSHDQSRNSRRRGRDGSDAENEGSRKRSRRDRSERERTPAEADPSPQHSRRDDHRQKSRTPKHEKLDAAGASESEEGEIVE